MKNLKPFAKTFYSETLVTTLMVTNPDKSGEAVEEKDRLVDLDDTKKPTIAEGGLPENTQFTTRSGIGQGVHAGLGTIYKYPGDPKK
jgi:TBC1 domain family member 8/9